MRKFLIGFAVVAVLSVGLQVVSFAAEGGGSDIVDPPSPPAK